ncbi:MAG: hypothetical protein HQK58_16345 [Deltaproteobacteria bacterium]|nr:hypothetical protein [Deltaproteobacteria bacterium]
MKKYLFMLLALAFLFTAGCEYLDQNVMYDRNQPLHDPMFPNPDDDMPMPNSW